MSFSATPASLPGRNSQIDTARFIAFIGVVFIHTVNDRITFALAEVARFAVPLFFCLSGYFLLQYHQKNIYTSIRKATQRIAPVYIFWWIVYLLLSYTLGISKITKIIGINFILDGGTGYHLWFLTSLLSSTILFLVLTKFLRVKKILIVSLPFYFLLVLFASYANVFHAKVLFDIRIIPFYGLPFIAAGALAAQNHNRLNWKTALFLFILATALNTAELVMIRYFGGGGFNGGIPDVRMATLPLGLAALALTLSPWPVLHSKNVMSRWGKKTLGFYAIHLVWVITITQYQAKPVFISIFFPTVVVILSIVSGLAGSRTRLKAFFS